MSSTGLVTSERYKEHDTGGNHPERSARLRAIYERLASSGLQDDTVSIAPVLADLDAIQRVHPEAYVERLQQACREGAGHIDTPECPVTGVTFEIARLAVGGMLQAVDAVMAGQVQNAFCAVRPPGHHAERSKAMGFCYFNNVAIAAEHLMHVHKLERIAVLDWDVHHGNGTQHHFEEDPRVFFVSSHQHPATLYPGTGYPNETGKGLGKGKTLNAAMMPHSDDEAYRETFEELLFPAIRAFEPQFLLISAGFDAHRDDPLANISLSTELFGWLTQQAVQLAHSTCRGRVVSVLEGGYELQSLADSVEIHLRELIDAPSV